MINQCKCRVQKQILTYVKWVELLLTNKQKRPEKWNRLLLLEERPGHGASTKTQRNPVPDPHHYPPNCILFLSNLPEVAHGMMLWPVKFSGFKEIGFILGKHDIAFSEFENGEWARDARGLAKSSKWLTVTLPWRSSGQ